MWQDNAEGSSRSDLELSPRQQAVLVGTLLGDGCLAKHGNYHRLHIKHKAAHRSLAEFKYDVFREYISMSPHFFGQKLMGERFPCVQFASRTNPIFTEWHSRFYRAGRKTVPDQIATYLEPLSIAVWLMDDGAADHAGVTFQTHSFVATEVELLADSLREKFELAVNLRKNRGASVIYVNAASVDRLRLIVRPHLLSEFNYKLQRRTRTP